VTPLIVNSRLMVSPCRRDRQQADPPLSQRPTLANLPAMRSERRACARATRRASLRYGRNARAAQPFLRPAFRSVALNGARLLSRRFVLASDRPRFCNANHPHDSGLSRAGTVIPSIGTPCFGASLMDWVISGSGM